ncbi:hypothetical protein MHYP_G00359540 [Metynnis hypsauchen]
MRPRRAVDITHTPMPTSAFLRMLYDGNISEGKRLPHLFVLTEYQVLRRSRRNSLLCTRTMYLFMPERLLPVDEALVCMRSFVTVASDIPFISHTFSAEAFESRAPLGSAKRWTFSAALSNPLLSFSLCYALTFKDGGGNEEKMFFLGGKKKKLLSFNLSSVVPG